MANPFFPTTGGRSSPRCCRRSRPSPRASSRACRIARPWPASLRPHEWHPLGAAPPGTRLWLRRDLLAPVARLAAGRPLGVPPSRAARPARGSRPHRLGAGEPGQRQRPGKYGGQAVGPNTTDRGKAGTKRHLLNDRQGVPLAARLTGANRHDSVAFTEVLDAVRRSNTPPAGAASGRPSCTPTRPTTCRVAARR